MRYVKHWGVSRVEVYKVEYVDNYGHDRCYQIGSGNPLCTGITAVPYDQVILREFWVIDFADGSCAREYTPTRTYSRPTPEQALEVTP